MKIAEIDKNKTEKIFISIEEYRHLYAIKALFHRDG